jgi:hypothetical protein
MSVTFPSGVDASVTAGSLGNYTRIVEGTVATTDTTITTVATVTTTNNSAGQMWLFFSGTRTNNIAERTTFEWGASYQNNAGTLTLNTTQYRSSEATAGTNAYVTASGSNILLRVRGETGWDITWTVTAIIIDSIG